MKKEIQHFNLGIKIQDTFAEIYSKNAGDSMAEIKTVAHEFSAFAKDIHTLWSNLLKKAQPTK